METQTAMRKNIYIPDEMKSLVDEFEKAGGNASELFQKALKADLHERREAAELQKAGRGEFARIVFEHELADGSVVKKAFRGRLLYDGPQVAVAETERHQIVTLWPWDDWVKEFNVFESAADFKNAEGIEEDVKSVALSELGEDYIQELDI